MIDGVDAALDDPLLLDDIELLPLLLPLPLADPVTLPELLLLAESDGLTLKLLPDDGVIDNETAALGDLDTVSEADNDCDFVPLLVGEIDTEEVPVKLEVSDSEPVSEVEGVTEDVPDPVAENVWVLLAVFDADTESDDDTDTDPDNVGVTVDVRDSVGDTVDDCENDGVNDGVDENDGVTDGVGVGEAATGSHSPIKSDPVKTADSAPETGQ